ncbi:MAG: kelch repeat-containing protein [Anaerolineae bacterium]|jgi:hypothetical protein|nr:kelch repeat-containing protein [Anaerolineae bacterium]
MNTRLALSKTPRQLAALLITLMMLVTMLGEPLAGWAQRLATPDACLGGAITLVSGDATITIENPNITNAGALGCQVSGALRIQIAGNNVGSIPITGRVDAYNAFTSTAIGAFNLEIAGLTLKAITSSFSDEALHITQPRIRIPDSWGGLEATIPKTFTLDTEGMSLISFGLPDIKAKDITLKLSGALGAYSNGYKITAAGELSLPDIGKTADCSISVSVTLYVNALGHTVMEIDTPEPGRSAVLAAQSPNAAPKAPAALVPAAIPLTSSYLPLPESLPEHVLAQLQTEEPAEGALASSPTAADATTPLHNTAFDAASTPIASAYVEAPAPPLETYLNPFQALPEDASTAAGWDGLELTAEAQCGKGIPIGATGFELTRVYGEVTLLPNDQHIALEVTFESSLKVFDISAVTVDGRTEIGWVPEFAFSLGGTVTLLSMFEAGGAFISVSESDGLQLRVWWNGLFVKGHFAIHAWLTKVYSCAVWNTICYDHYPLDPTCTTTCGAWNSHTKFHFTGSVSCQVGVAKGGLWSGRTIPYPCNCRWCKKWIFYYPCCKWCWVSMYMPPVDLWLAGAEAQFGEFTGDRWGVKGIISFLGFSLGFYVDHTGDVDFGDVSGYRLVDAQQLRAAQAAWKAAVLANGPQAAFAGDDTFTFLPDDKTLVHFNLPLSEAYRAPISVQDVITHAQVITQTDTLFSVKANVPLAVSLISPDGVEITPENYDEHPGGYTVAYSQTVTVEDLSASGPGPDRSRWRFIPTSNVAALRAVDVQLDATQVFTNVSVDDEQLQPYITVAPGAHTVQVQPAGGGGPALSAPFDVITGTDYTVLLLGYDAPELLVLEDDNSEPDPGAGRVRVVNVASDMGALDVSLDGISYQNVGYRQASSYQITATGAYSVTVASGLLPPTLGAVYVPESLAAASPANAGINDAGIQVIFGDKVAWAGDVNGDGYADALVADNADASDRGKVTLYLGTPGEPDTTAAWVKTGENAGDKFGIAVAGAGDVNNDGYADVLIGAYGFDANRGKAYLYLGSAAGLATEPVWTTLGENAGDLFGGAVAGAGDVNGDGYDDILIGAGGYDESHGKVSLYYGAVYGIRKTWTLTDTMAVSRGNHAAALLSDGRVLVAGGRNHEGELSSTELWDPATGAWTETSSLNIARDNPTATRLPDGRVLVVGGYSQSNPALTSAELYDPATGEWAETGSLHVGRYEHTATLLPNGKVLVTGGYSMPSPTSSAELYDPATGLWTATGDMAFARYEHTATLLPNGQVLVAGGMYGGSENNAEVYNPATGLWTVTGSMNASRRMHTAQLLTDGKVLVAGGSEYGYALASAEIYDPATGLWANTGNLNQARQNHTATLLPDGRVLATGGSEYGYSLASAEVFDPATGLWAEIEDMHSARRFHTATPLPNGQNLVTGGYDDENYLASAELYDPAARSWSATGENWHDEFGSALASAGDVNGDGYDDVVIGAHSYPSGDGSLGKAYLYTGSAVGLAGTAYWTATGADWGYELGISVSGAGDVNGDGYADVLIGAYGYPDTTTRQGAAYLYGGSASGLSGAPVWSVTGESAGDRLGNAVSGAGDVNRDGYADVLVGAYGYPGGAYQGQVTLYYGSAQGVGATGWAPTDSLGAARMSHAAVALTDGRVLVVGGGFPANTSAELYDPATGLWTPTGSLNVGHSDHTATLLADGRVLVAAGQGGSTIAELYDPATGLWTLTGNLNAGRFYHTAIRLFDGRVLVVGGEGAGGVYLASAELYNPATGLWTLTGNLNTGRAGHTATLLADGRVLVTGGYGGGDFLSSAEIYDPNTGTWTFTGSFHANQTRDRHAAIRLQDGKVLVIGGEGSGDLLASTELYDPATGVWTLTGNLATARLLPTATLLPDGRVLVAGGKGVGWGDLASAELYDPATGMWTGAGNLGAARWVHTATALPGGQVLIAGGESGGAPLASAELLTVAKAPWTATGAAAGAQFGISVAGGGGGGAIADANGDAHSDLLIGATGAEGGKAFLYYGALGLPATKAPVGDTDVQTLLIARFAGSEDPLSLLQVRDISYEAVPSVMTTTQYIVDQAITGTWTLSLIGNTDVASMTISAVAAPNPPILDQLTVDASDLENTLVTYRVLSDYRPITMRIFANDGPITETAVITLPVSLSRTTELTRTEVITLFQGIEAATVVISDALAVQNALITTTLDLSFLESGAYRLWARVEDGVSPPAQGYVWGVDTYALAKLPRAWNRVRIAAEDYDAGKQLAGAALIPIDHTAAWETSWPAVITPTLGVAGLHIEFTPYTHPDVDGYRLEVEEGGVTHVITTGLQVNYRYDELGRPVGESVHYASFNALSPKRTYSVRIAALDLDHDLVAWSLPQAFTVPIGTFTLSAVEPALELPTGQGLVTATLHLVMSEDLFSDVYITLESLQLPPGISLETLSYGTTGDQRAQVPRGANIPAPMRLSAALRQQLTLTGDITLPVTLGIRVAPGAPGAPGVPAATYTLPFIAHSGELERRVELLLTVGETPEIPVLPSAPTVLEPELPLPSCATAIVVTIPSGAFSVPATASFAQNSSNVEDPPQLSFAGLHFALTAQNAQSQPIQPVKALSLAVTYDPACLGGLRESELHLRRWSDTTGWGTSGVTCTPAPAQNRLNCSLSQLGRFAMFQLPEPDWHEIYLPLVLQRYPQTARR